MKSTVEEAMRKLFNPEFLNRIDEAIVFRNLEKEDILKIIEIELLDLVKNIAEHKMEIVLDQSAKNFLVEKGFDQKYGARPLKRAIQKYVEDPLAEEILRGSFKESAKILAKHVENTEELIFIDENLNLDIDEEKEKTDTGEA
jgi:ATP-dependent Clp protease ATP-binding subunit ClpC